MSISEEGCDDPMPIQGRTCAFHQIYSEYNLDVIRQGAFKRNWALSLLEKNDRLNYHFGAQSLPYVLNGFNLLNVSFESLTFYFCVNIVLLTF